MRMLLYRQLYLSPLGEISLTSDGKTLLALSLPGQKNFMPEKDISYETGAKSQALKNASLWLDEYFAGKRPCPSNVPLGLAGSRFQLAVWKLLLDIPYGECVSYGQLAREIARQMGMEKMSARAVGGAVGRNPISIIIPCHRVVGGNGNLTGYGGGIDLKIKLLQWEGVDISHFSMPKKI